MKCRLSGYLVTKISRAAPLINDIPYTQLSSHRVARTAYPSVCYKLRKHYTPFQRGHYSIWLNVYYVVDFGYTP